MCTTAEQSSARGFNATRVEWRRYRTPPLSRAEISSVPLQLKSVMLQVTEVAMEFTMRCDAMRFDAIDDSAGGRRRAQRAKAKGIRQEPQPEARFFFICL